ncbi:hypothetical protein ACPXCG_18820 [Gordonia sp. DT218]|uniref:hypothetical protein n=1 Tax=Gordonia sp. DT218 TaxID=3416659 RepID=UPI003CEAB931
MPDKPMILATTMTDGYGREYTLVDARLLAQARAEIAGKDAGLDRLAKQADRYMGERDALTAQRDADAATIAELRDVAAWLFAEQAWWRDEWMSEAWNHLSEMQETRRILGAHPEAECHTPDAARRVVAERDEARSDRDSWYRRAMQAEDELPTTDATNPTPEHYRFALEVVDKYPHKASLAEAAEVVGALRAEADRLEQSATRDSEAEKVIEEAARTAADVYRKASWGYNAFEEIAQALHARGLLALDNKGQA